MSDASPKAVFKTHDGMVDGHRAVVTVNHTLKDLAGKAWCPWHLTINILLDDELPSNDEEEALSQLEDDLHSLVRSVCEDFDYVGRVTVSGLRKLHFYLDAHEAAHEALTATIENGTPKELDHLLAYDPHWAEVDHLFDDA
jgi:Family of unknown function (DUF695)